MTTLRAAFSEFIRDCEAGRRSPKTIRWYQDKIKPLMKAHGDQEVNTITASDLRTLFIEIDQRVSEATAAGSRRAFRAFWRWAFREYRLPRNPMKGIRPLQTRRRAPKGAASSDILAMFRACPDTPLGARDRALLLLLAATGIRAGGLLTIRPDDIDFAARRLLVIEKGEKQRAVGVNSFALHCVVLWLKNRPSGAEFVFCADDGKPLSYWGLRQAFRRMRERAGVEGKVTPHLLRHWFAQEFRRQGGELEVLRELMGHASITTTVDFYAVFSQDVVAEIYDAHDPMRGLFRESV